MGVPVSRERILFPRFYEIFAGLFFSVTATLPTCQSQHSKNSQEKHENHVTRITRLRAPPGHGGAEKYWDFRSSIRRGGVPMEAAVFILRNRRLPILLVKYEMTGMSGSSSLFSYPEIRSTGFILVLI